MIKEKDLTQGNLWKQIILFSIPLIFSNLLQIVFNMADLIVAGQFAGNRALGAVGSTSILVTLFTGFAIGMGNGVNVILARFIGAKRKDDEKQTIYTSLIVCIIVGIILLVLGVSSANIILKILQTKPDFLEPATTYLHIYFCGLPALTIFNYGNGAYSAMGNTRKPLLFLVIGGVINVGLNLLFVIAFKMDVVGVALASTISQYISALLIVISLHLGKKESHYSFKEFTFSERKAKRILLFGLTSGLQYSIFAIANLFVQTGVNSFDEAMVQGNAAALYLDTIIYNIMAAFYLACTSFISQNYGANNRKRIIASYGITLFYAFSAAALFGLIMYFFGQEALSIFTKDSSIIEAGMKKLSIMVFSYFLSTFMDSAVAASRGLGKTLVPTILVIIGSCIYRIIWIYTIFRYFETVESLYLLYPTSWFLTSILECTYFAIIYTRIFKKNKNLLESNNENKANS